MNEGRRLFNLRWFAMVFASLLLGIAFSVNLYAGIIFFFVALIPLIFLVIKYNKRAVVILIIIAYILGFSYASGLNYANNDKKSYLEDSYISGRVTIKSKHNMDREVTSVAIIDDIIIGGEKVNGKAVVLLDDYDYSGIHIGDRVMLYGNMVRKELKIRDIGDSDDYNDNIYYTINAHSIETTGKNTLKVREKMILSVREMLFERLKPDTAAFVMGMLFGDTTMLYGDIKVASRRIGIAHLFAVSGLHVSMIVGFFMMILTKLKVRRKYHLLILPFLAIYAYICGYSVSILRASIMVTLLLISRAIYARYDILSAISLAGIILLLVNPFYLFDVSFIMSFLAVISIALFADRLTRLFTRKSEKFSRLKAILSANISVNIGLLPIMLYLYGGVSLITIPANLIILPIVGVIFPIFVLLLILVLLCHLSVLLPIICFPFTALVGLSKAMSTLNFPSLYFDVSSLFVPTYIIVMILVSKYVFIKDSIKKIPSILLCCILVLGLIVPKIQDEVKGNYIKARDAGNGYVALVEDKYDRPCLVVMGKVNSYMMDQGLRLVSASSLGRVYMLVVPSMDKSTATLVNYYNETIGADVVLTTSDVDIMGSRTVSIGDGISISNDGNVVLDVEEVSSLLASPNNDYVEYGVYDLIIANNKNMKNNGISSNHYINFAQHSQGEKSRDFTFYIKNGKINIAK